MTIEQFRTVCEAAKLNRRTVGAVLYKEPISPVTRWRLEQAARDHDVKLPRDLFVVKA